MLFDNRLHSNMYSYIAFKIHGAADHGDGVAGTVDHFLAYLESLAAKSPGEIVEAVFPGIVTLDNIHPLLVHFPIAFLSVFFLVDLLGTFAGKSEWRLLAGRLLYLGTIGAALTVVAGLIAADSVAHSETVHEIMENHENFGITVLTLASLLSVWRLMGGDTLHGAVNTLFLVFSAGMVAILILGADLGGSMVYRHGVAVDAAKMPESGHDHDRDDHGHDHHVH